MKWTECYSTEQELVKALMEIDITVYKRRLCKGYEFIEGFQKYHNKNGSLSAAQLRQLKRLAGEVYKYHNEAPINGATGKEMRW